MSEMIRAMAHSFRAAIPLGVAERPRTSLQLAPRLGAPPSRIRYYVARLQHPRIVATERRLRSLIIRLGAATVRLSGPIVRVVTITASGRASIEFPPGSLARN
jgi:hypothetical protein